MAITQVGSSTTGGASSGTFSVAKPTGVQEGDVLIIIGASNQGAWSTLPSGITQFAVSSDAGVSANFRAYGWYKVCGSSEPSSYSFGSTIADSGSAPIVVVMTAYRGVDTSDPVPHVSVDQGNASSEPSNATSGTAFSQTVQGLLFFARAARRGNAGGNSALRPTFSNGSANWSEHADDAASSASNNTHYGIGYFDHDTETGSGSRSDPAITCGVDEDTNVWILGCLRTKLATEVPAESVSGSTITNSPTPGIKVNAIGVGV